MKDYFLIAFGSLRKRFLRTSLTMLGIFIGIATVVALISLGQGMQDAINAQFASIGSDKVIVQGASAGFGPPGQNTAGIVDKNDLEIVRKIQGVKRAAGRLLRSVNLEFEENTVTSFAASLSEDAEDGALIIEANNLRAEYGRMLKPSDSKKIMVGNHFWTIDHFGKPLEIGSKLYVNGEKFEIAGLLDKIGAGRDESIIMNEKDMRELLDEDEEFSAIFAQVNNGENPADVADRIIRIMRRDRNQKEGFEDFTVSTSEDLISSINVILGVVQAVFIGIALISLLVGGIGIMNTMYTSVLEQTSDIGVMKAIGAKNSDIMQIFVIESGLLGLSGGAIGILIGIMLRDLPAMF